MRALKYKFSPPIASGKKGTHAKELENAKKNGFVRARINGEIHDLSEKIVLSKNQKHSIEIVVDRIVINKNERSRISDAVEIASDTSNGIIVVNVNMEKDIIFSKNFACPKHNIAVGELTPRMFSFNSPFGACKKCTGLGIFMKIDPNLIIPDDSKSISEGGIKGGGWSMEGNSIANMYYTAIAKKYKFSLDTPIRELPKNILDIILYGTKGETLELVRETAYGKTTYKNKFEGIITNLERRFRDTQKRMD